VELRLWPWSITEVTDSGTRPRVRLGTSARNGTGDRRCPRRHGSRSRRHGLSTSRGRSCQRGSPPLPGRSCGTAPPLSRAYQQEDPTASASSPYGTWESGGRALEAVAGLRPDGVPLLPLTGPAPTRVVGRWDQTAGSILTASRHETLNASRTSAIRQLRRENRDNERMSSLLLWVMEDSSRGVPHLHFVLGHRPRSRRHSRGRSTAS